jgi:hypothetical protein
MQSMCKNPYSARWPHHRQCPNLKQQQQQQQQHDNQDEDDWNRVTVKYGAATETYTSLAHLWNEWYSEYDAHSGEDPAQNYPWIMVRMEDVVFHTVETVTAVCQCAGGEVTEPFEYTVESAKKDSPGHDTSTGIVKAWTRYGQPLPPRAGFTGDDYEAALEAIDQNWMDRLHYHHPPPS